MSEERRSRKVFLISGEFLISSTGTGGEMWLSDGPGKRFPFVALGLLFSLKIAVISSRVAVA